MTKLLKYIHGDHYGLNRDPGLYKRSSEQNKSLKGLYFPKQVSKTIKSTIEQIFFDEDLERQCLDFSFIFLLPSSCLRWVQWLTSSNDEQTTDLWQSANHYIIYDRSKH